MGKFFVFGVAILSLILCGFQVYGQELGEEELKIFYEEVAWELNMVQDTQEEGMPEAKEAEKIREFASQYGLTREQLEDIMARGYNMPLTSREQEVASELKQTISALGASPLPNDVVGICRELADKYGMSFGQVGSIYGRSMEEPS